MLYPLDGPRRFAWRSVFAFYEDNAGSLWTGTNGGGMCRFKNGKFAIITVKNGLHDNRTLQILSATEDDSGDLWMSSKRVIFRVSLRELNDFAEGHQQSVTSFVYGVTDGMLSREGNGASPRGWKTRDGRLWFPTIKGVVAIDPRQRNTQPSRVAIEAMKIDNQTVPLKVWQSALQTPQSQEAERKRTAAKLHDAARRHARQTFRANAFGESDGQLHVQSTIGHVPARLEPAECAGHLQPARDTRNGRNL